MSLPRTPLLALAGAAAALPLLLTAPSTYAAAGQVWAVTKEAGAPAGRPTVPDGGGRAFFSTAAALLKGDTNGLSDAYSVRRDGAIRKLSSKAGGGNANGATSEVQVSGDGGTVVFATSAWNLWNSDHNEKKDVYACTGSCFSVGWVSRGMEPNGHSMHPRISADGKWVAFASDATNWVKGDTNGVRDVFVANVRNGVVTRVSVGSNGEVALAPAAGQIASYGGSELHTRATAYSKSEADAAIAAGLTAGAAKLTTARTIALAGGVTARVWHPYSRTPGGLTTIKLALSGSRVERVTLSLRRPPTVLDSY